MDTIRQYLFPGTGYNSTVTQPKTPQQNYLGLVHRLAEVFPDKELCHERGALEGEGVRATYNANIDDNYLYSLNAQTCIIVTLYNPVNRKGVVIHIDHNIQFLIEKAIQDAMDQIGGSNYDEISSTMSGGIWLGDLIGKPIKNALAKHGINPSWKQWSMSPCTSHCYGVVLELETGNVCVFDHSEDAYSKFLNPLFLRTQTKNKYCEPLSTEETRADVFMKRCKDPVIFEAYDGTLHFGDLEKVMKEQSNVTQRDINQKCIPIHNLDHF